MPELPEVETIRRQLKEHVIGLEVTSIEFPDRGSKVLKGAIEDLIGMKFFSTRRFGKLLVVDLQKNEKKLSLCIHLKMTGRLTLVDSQEEIPSHTHVILVLHNRKKLVFSDMRQFGFVHVISTSEVSQIPFINTLGKEPLKDFTFSDFEKICRHSKRPIKNLLLDQRKIAGIGNIYACECLWIAKIDPRKESSSIDQVKLHELFQAIEAVLQEGIARGGASDNTYRNLLGGKGKYQNFFKVYARASKPCLRCKTNILRIALAGRGTFFCPDCQK